MNTIKIYVKGGVVVDVENVPEESDYEIVDVDDLAAWVQTKFTSMKAANKWFYRHPVRDEILPALTLAEELGKMAEHDSNAKYRLKEQYQTPLGIVKVWEEFEP